MKNIIRVIILSLFLSSCASSYPTNDREVKKDNNSINLLIKIIESDDNKMLFDRDMIQYTDYTKYNKDDLVKISNALTEKIRILTKKSSKIEEKD
ncbi:hypothetical protein N8772_00150 [Rickettsiales bacterium]|nr:hypothetical protein [Rickettsiales bacterium]MDB2550334.1 hypothetical protein [Rickettsiales bacterium]